MSGSSKGIFDKFTNQYSLSKTLRFELRPVWNTKNMLDNDGVFNTDKVRRDKYEQTKPWIDRLHQEFIVDALTDFQFVTLRPYEKALLTWQENKKSKDTKVALAKEEKLLREEIVKGFNQAAAKWVKDNPELNLKKKDVNILFEAGVFELLKKRYGEEPGTTVVLENGRQESIFDDWKGWTSYFKKFFINRVNYYSSGDESTAIAFRIVNQNLRKFYANIRVFNEISRKINMPALEKSLDVSFSSVFSLQKYGDCFLQAGIDRYNRVIGGYVVKNERKVPGINQAINEYRQQHPGDKLPYLTMLDKQIHGVQDVAEGLIDNDEEFIVYLKSFIESANSKLDIVNKLVGDLTNESSAYDLNKIYLSSQALERNAGRWFEDYARFETALLNTVSQYTETYSSLDLKWKVKDGVVKYPDFVVLEHVKTALAQCPVATLKGKYLNMNVDVDCSAEIGQLLHIIRQEMKGSHQSYKRNRDCVTSWLCRANATIDKEAKASIKSMADSALTTYQIAKYFSLEKQRRWLEGYDLDDRFYKETGTGYLFFYEGAYETIVKGYNQLRNYLTRKPYSDFKWLLNFDNQTLAAGWDKNKEKDNATVVFREGDRYFLGIMHHNHTGLFLENSAQQYAGSGYEKMEYKFFPEASKMIPKCSTQLVDVQKHFEESSENYILFKAKDFVRGVIISHGVYRLNNVLFRKDNIRNSFVPKNESQKKEGVKQFQKEYLVLSGDELGYRVALEEWITFCISFLRAYKSTSIFDYSVLKNPQEYGSLDEFYKDVNALTYSHLFSPISEAYLREKNNAGELYVFEIHNKDWNLKEGKKKSSSKNLHTIYWEKLFSEENAKDNFIFKLNGEAEIFFRPKTDAKKLKYKTKKEPGVWRESSGKAKEAVIDHKRYADDKIFFHCPIMLNRVSENKRERELNADIRKAVASSKETRIIGIDRGEKNLAYYSVIDQEGRIIEDGSLNTIGSANGHEIPYAEKLAMRAEEREDARREWRDVEAIKDLKRGYVSQVVRKLADLAVAYPGAIIVLEDLNMRFKQVRGGIEKSVYQQLEKQLIDKLSFLVDKQETDSDKPGHPLNAYQLAAPIQSFKDMGKQTGIIFYTAAGYTSRTCPQCGYRRNVRFAYDGINEAKEKIRRLDAFTYDAVNNSFIISYSLNNYLSREQLRGSKMKNKLYEDVNSKTRFVLSTRRAIRYKWFSHQSPRIRALAEGAGVEEYPGSGDEHETSRGVVKKFDISAYIKGLLAAGNITLIDGDLRDAITSTDLDKKFYERLMFSLFLLTETRQTISGSLVDYIHCPECGFDSSKDQFQGRQLNGDANGAYNIACKGTMILEKIRQFQKKNDISKMNWGDLSISIEEWDKFSQLIRS